MVFPPITVVIPTHHRPSQLNRLLESLRQQKYPPDLFEVLVIPSPNDDAAKVVADTVPTSPYVLRCISDTDDPTGGRSASRKRNFGVVNARHDWIAFIDDDCVAGPDWLAHAARLFTSPNVAGVEGRKIIPPVHPPTLPYKGLKSFERSGGYQTCNMFYSKKSFESAGGFDPMFPYYLEDSDLAWSVLDSGGVILYAAGAVVYHPVPDAEPWRLLDDARRVSLLPLLFRKHRDRFTASKMRALRLGHWAYLAIYLVGIVALSMGQIRVIGACLGTVVILLVVQLTKSFWGCSVGIKEFCVTAMLYPILPVIRLVSLLYGNRTYGVWLWS